MEKCLSLFSAHSFHGFLIWYSLHVEYRVEWIAKQIYIAHRETSNSSFSASKKASVFIERRKWCWLLHGAIIIPMPNWKLTEQTGSTNLKTHLNSIAKNLAKRKKPIKILKDTIKQLTKLQTNNLIFIICLYITFNAFNNYCQVLFWWVEFKWVEK